jgi:integrase
LERKEPEIAQATASFYRNAADKFLAFMSDRADADLTEITRDDIIRFRNGESKRFAPKTVNHEIKFLRMIFRAAKRDALISDDPAEFVDTVRRGKAIVRRPFSIAEIKAVLSVADPDWRSMILFGLYTGQRLGDVATLTWQNIDLQHGEIRLVTHKTHKTLILPMAAPLRKRTGAADGCARRHRGRWRNWFLHPSVFDPLHRGYAAALCRRGTHGPDSDAPLCPSRASSPAHRF